MGTYHEGYETLKSDSTPSFCVHKCSRPLQGNEKLSFPPDCKLRQWFVAFTILVLLHLYYNTDSYNNKLNNINLLNSIVNKNNNAKGNFSCINFTQMPVYKYPLTNSSEVIMTFSKRTETAYSWFESMKHLLVNIGKDEESSYPNNTPVCTMCFDKLEQIVIDKTEVDVPWVERQHSDVKPGGFHAPKRCRSKYRVAIFVAPSIGQKRHLGVFLYYLHRLLKKQMMEYRIFVIEQFDTTKWNKGMLYNIAYLESQRFGTWDCLIFHEVDLIPVHEKLLYGCYKNPHHLASVVEYNGFLYPKAFGGVTALTPEIYEDVNGYSNLFWNTNGFDADMKSRLLAGQYSITRYNISITIYASLAYEELKKSRDPLNITGGKNYRFEGLTKTKYSLIKVRKEKLFTHLLCNIYPDNNVKICSKNNLMLNIIGS